MLQKKIQSTIGLIEDVIDNRSIANEKAYIAKRNTSFFDSLEKLAPTISSYILAKKNFNFELNEESAIKIRELMVYSKSTFENSKVVNPDSFRKKVDLFIDEISQEWTKYYKEISCELISGLDIMIPVHSTPLVIKKCVITLKKCEKWPLTQEMIDDYISAEKKAQELLKDMRFDDDIKIFLEKIRSHTATLVDVTPHILEWIRSENISDKIALTIKGV